MKILDTFKKITNINFIIQVLLIPFALLAIYFVSFAFVTFKLFGKNVNFDFANRSWHLLLVASGIILVIVLIQRLSTKSRPLIFSKSTESAFRPGDLFLLLLPLTSVVQYIISNRSILSFLDIVLVVVFFAGFFSTYIYLVPALFNRIGLKKITTAIGAAFVTAMINMALLSQMFHWFQKGSLKIQLVYFVGLFLIFWVLINLKKKSILYLILGAFFVLNTGNQLWVAFTSQNPTALQNSKNNLHTLINGRSPVIKSNIYLLIYDSYVPMETMQAYGIDNNAQTNYLVENGFELYPHTYSIGADSANSMGRVLDISNDLPENIRTAVAGNGAVQNAFKELGYSTYGLFTSDYMFRGTGSFYDVYYPKDKVPPYNHLISAILMGEFRFDLGFDEQTHEEYVLTKDKVFSKTINKQIFVYSHTNLPNHSQNSGVCLPNENDLYEERLIKANNEMRQDINNILGHDKDAIIIVAGDHGPYLTKNCYLLSGRYDKSEISRLDIQDRYGTFLAIKWPTGGYEEIDDFTVLQDVFPVVFAYIYNDVAFLELKVNPVTINGRVMDDVYVENGVIHGGINDGEPLFLSE